MEDKILVQKFELGEGEELNSFINAAMSSLPEGMYLKGIYSTHLIAREAESGRMFKMPFTRKADGSLEFGESKEVMQAFVEVGKAEEQVEVMQVFVTKSGPRLWEGVL